MELTNYWTTKEIVLVKKMVSENKNLKEISKVLKRPYKSVYTKAYNLGLKAKQGSKYCNKQFALYRNDKYLTEGTIEQLAEYLGVTVRTIRFYMNKAYLERTTENATRIIEID